MDVLNIAHVCHDANRAYARTLGDFSHLPWEEAPDWSRNSSIKAVEEVMRGATPRQLHALWMKTRSEDGWVYGPVKDMEKKTNPALVNYDDLPDSQRVKDDLFHGIVHALAVKGTAAPAHGEPIDSVSDTTSTATPPVTTPPTLTGSAPVHQEEIPS